MLVNVLYLCKENELKRFMQILLRLKKKNQNYRQDIQRRWFPLDLNPDFLSTLISFKFWACRQMLMFWLLGSIIGFSYDLASLFSQIPPLLSSHRSTAILLSSDIGAWYILPGCDLCLGGWLCLLFLPMGRMCSFYDTWTWDCRIFDLVPLLSTR